MVYISLYYLGASAFSLLPLLRRGAGEEAVGLSAAPYGRPRFAGLRRLPFDKLRDHGGLLPSLALLGER